ncbi:MAG: NAD(P)H-dependent glycerol-3-phosphate dehydrogenase [Desulfuromonadia bacterium]
METHGPIAVIGAGSWGTTLADLLAKKGIEVRLWAYERELESEINKRHENGLYLPGIPLSPRLTCTGNLETAITGADLVLFVTPSQVTRMILRDASPHITPGTIVVSASKGVEISTNALMSDIFREVLGEGRFGSFAVLSGPSFAREVATEMPTAVTVASLNPAVARRVQELFTTPWFRVYTNDDIIGVELGGAVKNVIAIAAGIVEGLGYGHNTKAALITRGLAEMTRLGVALGGKRETFAGLAGMGDLLLTCTGDLSRNRSVGIKLGKGRTLDDILAEMVMIAEGVQTTASVHDLATSRGVEMPIVAKVHEVLYGGKSPREGVVELMTRDLRPEQDAP